MNAERKRNLMLAMAGAVLIAGVVVAVVSSTAGNRPHRPQLASTHVRNSLARHAPSTIAAAAAYLGLTRAQLRARLHAGQTLAQIANATSGRSATGLLNALGSARAAQLREAASVGELALSTERTRLASLHARLVVQINRPHSPALHYSGLEATLRYLGLSAARLHAELRAGHSIAQVANTTPGKSAGGLIDARVGARKQTLETAVALGRITHADETALLASLRRRLTSEIERVPRA